MFFGLPQAPGLPGVFGGQLVLAPRSVQFPNDAAAADAIQLAQRLSGVVSDPSTIDAGIEQAGLGGLLLDQDGYPVYYSIAVNREFADFIDRNGITSGNISTIPPDLQFTSGVVELKAAWKIIVDPLMDDNYIVAKAAQVPNLVVVNNELKFDGTFRSVDVALIALHVVFSMPGHPELVWSTFQHIDASGAPDLAPSAPDNEHFPGVNSDFLLYLANTVEDDANQNQTMSDLASHFDVTQQKFTANGVPLSTPVYREFPASKAATTDVDVDVVAINKTVLEAFSAGGPAATDKRRYYQLVGATWLDEPELTFELNQKFRNAPGQSSDDGPVAGEDALSSVAMESFTQDSFSNCFSCHDTRRVTSLDGTVLLLPKRLNVSHVLTKFLEDQ